MVIVMVVGCREAQACRCQWSAVVEVKATDRGVLEGQGTEPVSLHGNQTWRACDASGVARAG